MNLDWVRTGAAGRPKTIIANPGPAAPVIRNLPEKRKGPRRPDQAGRLLLECRTVHAGKIGPPLRGAPRLKLLVEHARVFCCTRFRCVLNLKLLF